MNEIKEPATQGLEGKYSRQTVYAQGPKVGPTLVYSIKETEASVIGASQVGRTGTQ